MKFIKVDKLSMVQLHVIDIYSSCTSLYMNVSTCGIWPGQGWYGIGGG